MRPLFFALTLSVALAEPPAFPEPHDNEKTAFTVMSAADAAKGFKVPAGFRVEVFASEPQVRNPIACAWDTRGRFWVAENFTYTERKFDLSLRDRILIFHDKDGDGKPDERKVFTDNLQRLTSIEVGLGGVWALCPPQLLFIPDADGNDVPDREPIVVLEGFDVPSENHHNFANGLKWGPDGWLYGRCGASAPGNVRSPEQTQSVPLAGGVWRYHPQRKVFEPLCHGTTNPWGHDWDAQGNCFFINTVNGHLWHMIPGAHYRRPHTISPNPLVYEPMEMIADHWHFDTGKGWVDSRKVDSTVDKLGGGHAHIGCLIYNGDNWPADYRGKLLTLNMHGRRINVEKLERSGSCFVGKHEPDMCFASDPMFRGMELSQAPDGSVYVLDWHDAGECHDHTGVVRSTGRIYRIVYGSPKAMTVPNLADASIDELFEKQLSSNEWLVRQSRMEIIRRCFVEANANLSFIQRQLPQDAIRKKVGQCVNDFSMREPLPDHAYYALQHTSRALRMYRTDSFARYRKEYRDFNMIHSHLGNYSYDRIDSVDSKSRASDDYHRVRSWPLHELNVTPQRMLDYASLLQRLSLQDRVELSSYLLSRNEVEQDRNLACLIWYGLIPVALEAPIKLVELAINSKSSLVRKWTSRRFAEIIDTRPECMNELLLKATGLQETARSEVMMGIVEGLAGIRKAKAPTAWAAFAATFKDDKNIAVIKSLNIVFGDGRALDDVRKVTMDDKANLEQRKAALKSLIDADPADLRSVCEQLLKVRFLNTVALKGLAKFDDAAPTIIKAWGAFHPSERPAVIDVLCSRPTFAAVLLELMEKGTVKRTDLSAAQARSIRGFDKPELTAKLTAVWGEFRESSKDKAELISKLKADLAMNPAADAGKGRTLFAKTCASCHKLYGEGQSIGPDLTGAGRKDIDYLLSNIVDPSAVVTKDFQVTKFVLTDGRVLNGIVVASAPKTITIQLEKEKVTVAKDEIESQKASTQSLMPDGLLQTLDPQAVRDLVKYLQTESQVEAK